MPPKEATMREKYLHYGLQTCFLVIGFFVSTWILDIRNNIKDSNVRFQQQGDRMDSLYFKNVNQDYILIDHEKRITTLEKHEIVSQTK